MAPSRLSDHVQSLTLGFTKPGFEAQVTPVIISSKDEDSDMPHLERISPTKTDNDYHEDFHTPNTTESLDYGDPVVIVGIGG